MNGKAEFGAQYDRMNNGMKIEINLEKLRSLSSADSRKFLRTLGKICDDSGDRFGLTLDEGRLVYGGRSYFYWLPEYLEMAIIGFWNPVACHFLGHRWLCRDAPGHMPKCTDCCQYIKDFDEDEVMNEW